MSSDLVREWRRFLAHRLDGPVDRVWSGIITRQSVRRGTFSSVRAPIKQIRDHITHWNSSARPFQWTATGDEILTQVRLTQQNVRKLVDNNGK